jgi:predicted DNA-binding transcriptional regulator YafY
MERLRGLGYPIESTRGQAGGYRLRAGAALPPLLLDDDEATAIAVGLRTAAGAGVSGVEENALRALVKLEQVLPSHLRRRVAALEAATTTVAFGGGPPQVDPGLLTDASAACRDGERLRLAYRDRRDDLSDREVEPHALVNAGRRWYLVAWDRDRDDWRTFRLDRVERLRPSGGRFAPRELPGGDAAAFVRARLSPAHRHEAVATVRAPAGAVRAVRWLGGTVEAVDATTSLLRTSDADLEWLALRVASMPFEFELHGEEAIVDRLRDLGARLVRATAGAGSSSAGT